MPQYEVYFGYQEGDLKLWDTAYVTIPRDTPAVLIPAALEDAFMAANPGADVAFIGQYAGPVQREEEDVPVLFLLDPETREAVETLRFCGDECRHIFVMSNQQIASQLKEGTEYLDDLVTDERCTVCGIPLDNY